MSDDDILIIDDEQDIRNLIQGILEDEGYKTRGAGTSGRGYEEIAKKKPSLIILDIWLQGSEHDGLEILKTVKQEHPHLPIIMISGHGTIETAVSAIKEGAYDFIEKPFKSDRLLLMIKRALETAALRRENETLRQKSFIKDVEMVGQSPALKNFKQVLARVAKTNSRVLLTGEPGCGKEVAARAIHKASERADKPFLILNCATLRPERLEIELFGATKDIDGEAKTGLLEQAHEGTLLLDEVSDMPLETQAKILHVLQEQKFQKIGSSEQTTVDVRILASTNKDLQEEVREERFREDLFYRLNVVPIHIPALKERSQDIPELVEYFVKQLHKETGMPLQNFSKSAYDLLKQHSWPGNIRQLRNTVEWTLIMNAHTPGQEIGADKLPPELRGHSKISHNDADDGISNLSYMELPLKEARDLFEKGYIDSQIKRFDGNISKTAEFIGMERSALHRKIKSLRKLASANINDQTESQDMDSNVQKQKTA